MRYILKWACKIQDSENNFHCVYDICFHPNGNELIVAAGLQVLIYSTDDGTLLQALKGHKDIIYCVCYSSDGQKMASGSADKCVIIWNNKYEGLIKYTHGEAIQCLAFGPMSNIMVSCSITDFGFWFKDHKTVQKHRVGSRITCCSWTNDGHYVALGMSNGIITIRNRDGEERAKIDRSETGEECLVWALNWSPSTEEGDILCVTDWNKNLSFYGANGKMFGRERYIGFDALCVSYFPNGDFMLISGCSKECILLTKDGVKLGNVGDVQTHWIWSAKPHPKSQYVAFGCQDGLLSYYQVMFNVVHSIYKERYSYRENMTDVIIQHLITDQRVRIKCRDLIKKIAIYKDRLAVQLPERIVIYELNSTEPNSMHYKVSEKISQKIECNLLVICSQNLIICQDNKLICYTFSGSSTKEWILISSIRYIKCVDGLPGQEELLIGLKNGEVWKIYINKDSPEKILSVSAAIRCLDLNSTKTKLAVVDDTFLCQIYQIDNNYQLLFMEHNTNSVAWSIQHENLLCFSGEDNIIGLRLCGFSSHRKQHIGLVVGFSENKVFYLHGNLISSIEMPLASVINQCLSKRMFDEAFKIALLGVAETTWKELGITALEEINLDVAQKVYQQLENIEALNLINDLQNQIKKGETNMDLIKGQVCAYLGKYKEAAKLYQRAGHSYRAVDMYTKLKMFDQAQDYITHDDDGNNEENKNLIRQKADWALNINEPKAAADLYLTIGDIRNAVQIMVENKWVDLLIDLSQRLDKAEKDNIVFVAEQLRQLNEFQAAAELYRRLGDELALLKLYVDTCQWAQAFALIENHPESKSMVYVPYAQWLIENDRFVEAQKVFHKAGKPESAFQVLYKLIKNAIIENRFHDVGYLHWILAHQCLDLAKLSFDDIDKRTENILKFKENQRLSAIYYAYHTLHRYLEEPFTSYIPEALFNIARFVMNETKTYKPKGISQITILYSLVKQSKQLGANKLAKQLLDKLKTLRIPHRFQEQIEIATLSSYTKQYNDPEHLLPMCYRCSTYNPLIAMSNVCSHCHQPFVFSFVSFEILPLIEFELESDITDMEAVRLIESPVNENQSNDLEIIDDDKQVLEIDDGSLKNQIEDSFLSKMINQDINDSPNFVPIIVNRDTLRNFDPSEVIICKWPPPLRYQYFRNLLPNLEISICHSCYKTFDADDFELQLLQKGSCPFCKVPIDVANGKISSLDSNDIFEKM